MESILSATLLSLGYLPLGFSPESTPSASFELYPLEKRESVHVVKPGESLSSISYAYYDSTEYWSSLYVDNTHLSSPEIITEGTKLKVRAKPIENAAKHERLVQITQQPEVVTLQISPIVASEPSAAPAVAPTSAPAAPVSTGGPLNDAQIQFLGNCEAGMNPTRNSGNGYYGAFQFSYGTWARMNTGYERADLAPLDVQIAAVQQLLSRSSIWSQFPGCASRMQAAGLL